MTSPAIDIQDQRQLALARELDSFLKESRVATLQREHLTGRAPFDVELIPHELRTWCATLTERIWVGGSALLCGPPGTGKTLAAAWVLAETWRRCVIDAEGSPRGGRRASCMFARVTDFRWAAIERNRGLRRAMERVQMLVIDDVGEEADPDGLTAADLDETIDRRWSNRRCTVVTSNLPGEGEGATFANRYPRAASRLFDSRGPGLIEVVRQDMRTKGVE